MGHEGEMVVLRTARQRRALGGLATLARRSTPEAVREPRLKGKTMIFHRSRTDKAKEALSHAVSYADEFVHDDRLRADLRSALEHAAVAARQLRDNSGVSGFSSRLAEDKDLRRSVRSMLDDLDRAAEQARRKSSHRARNGILVLAGGGVLLASFPAGRRWFTRTLALTRRVDVVVPEC